MPDSTLKIGLVGAHISRSRLARALDLFCTAEGLTLDFRPRDSAEEDIDFESLIRSLPAQGFDGFTVTHPFKTRAHDMATHRHMPPGIGSANTLIFSGDAIHAHNTDHSGFTAAWSAAFAPSSPGTVLMAGAGGVSRAIARGLLDLGADEVLIFDLDEAAARIVAQDTGATAIAVTDAPDAASVATGLVNATPMGMAEHPGMAFTVDMIGSQRWVFDAVYFPIETMFVATARAAGIPVLTGFDLFRHMACQSFATYTGRPAPDPAHLTPLAEGL